MRMCRIGKRGSSSQLCDDLVVEILCWLPVEDLIRSKCVCKSWNRLITDVCVPKISTLSSIRGFFYRGFGLEYISCDDQLQSANGRMVESLPLLPFKFTAVDLIHSCNGLLLLVRGLDVPQFYVCNPLTRQSIEIPRNLARKEATAIDVKFIDRHGALAFNPAESSHYKLVTFYHSSHNYSMISNSNTVDIDVFSSETGVWVKHTMPLEAGDPDVLRAVWPPHRLRVVYLHGVLYRLSHSEQYLLQFDLNELKARATELPKRDVETRYSEFIGVSGGRLHYTSNDNSILCVWFLDGRSWVMKHSICVNDLCKYKFCVNDLCKYKFGRRLMHCHPCTFHRPWALDPNSEAIFFASYSPKVMLKYQVDSGAMEVIASLDFNHYIKGFFPTDWNVHAYTACPMALKGFNGSR